MNFQAQTYGEAHSESCPTAKSPAVPRDGEPSPAAQTVLLDWRLVLIYLLAGIIALTLS